MPLDPVCRGIGPTTDLDFSQIHNHTSTTPSDTQGVFEKPVTPVDPPGLLAREPSDPDLTRVSGNNTIESARITEAAPFETIRLGNTVEFSSLREGTTYIGRHNGTGKAEFLGVHTHTTRSEDAKQARIQALKETIAQQPPRPKSGFQLPSVAEMELGNLLHNDDGTASTDKFFTVDGQETRHAVTKGYRDTGGVGKFTSYTEVLNFEPFLNTSGAKADNSISNKCTRRSQAKGAITL